eukprot:4268342-Pyramimonas_sp.AAC.1
MLTVGTLIGAAAAELLTCAILIALKLSVRVGAVEGASGALVGLDVVGLVVVGLVVVGLPVRAMVHPKPGD